MRRDSDEDAPFGRVFQPVFRHRWLLCTGMPNDNPPPIECQEIDCPLCGVRESTHVMTSHDFLHAIPGEFTVVRCSGCRHEFTNPQPVPESLALCYPSDYGPHRTGPTADESEPICENEPAESATSEDRADPASQPTAPAPWYLNRVVRSIPGLRGLYYWLTETKGNLIPETDRSSPQALELGCATGQFLVKLRDAGWTASGVELMPDAAERARRAGFNVHTGDLFSTSFEQHSFDAVFAWMVIEHVPNPRDVLQRIHELLNDDGWFVFSIPNVGCWERYVFGRYWYSWELPRHLQHFRPRTIARLLNSSGFDRVQIIHQPNLLNVIGSIGHWMKRWRPNSRLARRIIDYPDRPSLIGQLLLAVPARLLSLLKQGGRLTVVCRRSESIDSQGSGSGRPA